jgi:hypothetical protein
MIILLILRIYIYIAEIDDDKEEELIKLGTSKSF